MRLIDADAYAAEMKKRQDACMDARAERDDEAIFISERDHWDGVFAAFVEAKITLDKMPTVSGWVSVKDRMPDESGSYLVMLDNVFVPHLAINVHYWNAKDEYWRGSEAHSRIVGISHWMPLPEPPKEGLE